MLLLLNQPQVLDGLYGSIQSRSFGVAQLSTQVQLGGGVYCSTLLNSLLDTDIPLEGSAVSGKARTLAQAELTTLIVLTGLLKTHFRAWLGRVDLYHSNPRYFVNAENRASVIKAKREGYLIDGINRTYRINQK